MALERTPNAQLAGWQGPFFYPKRIDALAAAILGAALTGEQLERTASRVRDFSRCFRPTAGADGYDWFWALEFKALSWRVLIGIPWETEGELDRCPAIYTQYNPSEQFVDAVIMGLTAALNAAPTKR